MATVLAQVPLHCECVLAALPALPHEQRRRLQELGFREGISLTVTQKTAGGGRIVSIGNTRYAIDGVTAKALSAEQGPAATNTTAPNASAPKTTATTDAPTKSTAQPEAGVAARGAAPTAADPANVPAAADPANKSAAQTHSCHCCTPASSEEHDQ